MDVFNAADYTILIVDDNPTNVMFASVLMDKSGYCVKTASGGEEALDIISESKPDLILLDVMMPDLDGFQVSQILRSDPETADIPIIFLTALNESKDEVKCFEMGGNDYLSKPIQKEILQARVLAILRQTHAKNIIKKQRNELEKIVRSRDKMYSVIAHDLRSPLGTIKMIHNMLLMSIDKETIGEDLYEMLENANQLTQDTFMLLDNLLKWTKSQLNRLNVVFQRDDLVRLVDDMASVYMQVASAKHIRIECITTEPKYVKVDIDLVKTIVRNLLSNAIKFSKEDEVITIEVKEDEENVIISIEDHGVGIKEEDQAKVLGDTGFTTYGTNDEEGTGLGLALCVDFVQKNNGKIWFTSVYGEGTTFFISFPKDNETPKS